jgi:hypothetical protein
MLSEKDSIMERSNQNPGEAFPDKLQMFLEAIRTPTSQWAKQHDDAVRRLALIFPNLARKVLFRFKLPMDYHTCCDAQQEAWELICRDQFWSMKLEYGIDKYGSLMMMRACGRIADRRGYRLAKPIKKLQNASTNPASPVENVSRLDDQPARRRVRPLSEADNAVANGPTPLEQVEQLQSAKEIAVEINRLRASLREPIKCVFYDGLNVKATAEKLGVTPNAVRMRVYYALNILRPRLSRFRK